MHELSIALNIFDIALEKARSEKADKVIEIELDVGQMSGIEYHALEFALETSRKDKLLEETSFKINHIKATARCLDCSTEFEILKSYDPCKMCKGNRTEIIAGRELKIKSLLID